MCRILVIDDEKMVCEIVMKILERGGYQVTGVDKAGVGLEMFREHPFNVVITDLTLPDGDGLEIIQELSAEFPDTRYIAMSGSGQLLQDGFLTKARDMGVNQVLHKPFTAIDLLDTVSGLVEGNAARI